MAGFVHNTMQPQQHNARAHMMYMEEAPCYGYGYGFYYNPGLQNIEALTPQYGGFNGLGENGKGYSEPPVQPRMPHNNRPYSANRSHNGSATWVQVGPNPYYMCRGNQTIQGDVVQRGTFNGRGTGARLCGHFSVSGDIN